MVELLETRKNDVFADAGIRGTDFDGLHKELEEKTKTTLPEFVLCVCCEFNEKLHL